MSVATHGVVRIGSTICLDHGLPSGPWRCRRPLAFATHDHWAGCSSLAPSPSLLSRDGTAPLCGHLLPFLVSVVGICSHRYLVGRGSLASLFGFRLSPPTPQALSSAMVAFATASVRAVALVRQSRFRYCPRAAHSVGICSCVLWLSLASAASVTMSVRGARLNWVGFNICPPTALALSSVMVAFATAAIGSVVPVGHLGLCYCLGAGLFCSVGICSRFSLQSSASAPAATLLVGGAEYLFGFCPLTSFAPPSHLLVRERFVGGRGVLVGATLS